ncbi:MAG: MMPL family transporter, partial [Verrucomicrobiae bacterium]|nr:MMPL family transporter [Verrucomicrobiae bacterium]
KYRSLSKRAEEAEATFKALIPALERAVKALDGVSQEEAGRRLDSFQVAIFGPLQKVLRWLASQEADRPVGIDDIPEQLKERYLGKTGKVLIEVYPKEDAWEREPNVRFVRDLRSVDPKVTGSPVQNFEYIEVLKRSFEQAAVYALVVICVAVVLHFRSVPLALLTLLPLGLGILWTLGMMPALGLRFSPANIITLPLVIGIGVAYGIYAVDRFREDATRPLFETSTGKSVWLSALTTMFGFGALIQASYRGISSLGLLMTIGVGMCLLASLYFLPACLRLFGRRRGSGPSGGG